ncbi:HNH endonuclease signature motif containing protein [Streptomyces longwoodensis]|uniref:HNH endonuclease signature motif containing protein n=1 Tax=Streptomyces longwoodensis TaxID=68231 RepID=UPI003701AD65
MWHLNPPSTTARDSYVTCVSGTQDAERRKLLLDATGAVTDAGERFRAAAAAQTLHELAENEFTLPDIPNRDAVKWAYSNGMRSLAGRAIYDQLMDGPEDERCPMCGYGEVYQLDHVLPKIKFPALCVDPLNLVPACAVCNHTKGQVSPRNIETTPLHPYLDQIDHETWLDATVISGSQGELTYFISPPLTWDDTLTARVKYHFHLFQLGKRYGGQANRALKNIRSILQQQLQSAGESAVRDYLIRESSTRLENDRNGWDGVAYRVWAGHDAFCRGDFGTGPAVEF